jgi:hypothetical protein
MNALSRGAIALNSQLKIRIPLKVEMRLIFGRKSFSENLLPYLSLFCYFQETIAIFVGDLAFLPSTEHKA